MSDGRIRFRPIELLRAAWGASMLFAPRLVLGRVHKVGVDRPSVVIARVLGARQLAQALLSGGNPSPEVLAMGVWVDATHAASAVGLAVLDRTRARAGVTDTVVAGTWAVAGYHDIPRVQAQAPGHDRRRDRLARAVLAVVPGGRPLRRAAERARPGVTAGEDERQVG